MSISRKQNQSRIPDLRLITQYILTAWLSDLISIWILVYYEIELSEMILE